MNVEIYFRDMRGCLVMTSNDGVDDVICVLLLFVIAVLYQCLL